MARSLNRVQLIGNLTRDPELRYTPTGTAVCSFGMATNRSWTTESGEKRDEADFHRIVAWNKLAELCSQFLTKGKKVFVEGRLSTRNWNAQDGTQKTTTEIIISDMILLDSGGIRSTGSATGGQAGQGRTETAASTGNAAEVTEPAEESAEVKNEESSKQKPAASNAADATTETLKKTETRKKSDSKKAPADESVRHSQDDEVAPDDIPF